MTNIVKEQKDVNKLIGISKWGEAFLLENITEYEEHGKTYFGFYGHTLKPFTTKEADDKRDSEDNYHHRDYLRECVPHKAFESAKAKLSSEHLKQLESYQPDGYENWHTTTAGSIFSFVASQKGYFPVVFDEEMLEFIRVEDSK